mmetsp:Transcript_8231/g.15258  ORF Transcript_8231/g.15258 Transcript_8231/m.15258 type:complete len:84 (+) Transcript_8231:153-404(+)
MCGGECESFKEITRKAKKAMWHCGTASYCDSCGCERAEYHVQIPACASLPRLSREPRQPISSRNIPKSEFLQICAAILQDHSR